MRTPEKSTTKWRTDRKIQKIRMKYKTRNGEKMDKF